MLLDDGSTAYLLHVLHEQYPKTLPLSVVMLMLRLGVNTLDITPALSRKLLLHASTCSETERASLLNELRQNVACPGLAQVIDSISAEAPRPSICSVYEREREKVSQGDYIPFSRASIWTRQKSYYKKAKLAAWSDGTVPHHISSNAFVAELYLAKIAAAISTQPHSSGGESGRKRLKVKIVELGAGHGILSMLLCWHLRERSMGQRVTDLTRKNIVVDCLIVATDFHSLIFDELVQLPWVEHLCSDDDTERSGGTARLSFATPQSEGSSATFQFVSEEKKGPVVDCCDLLVIVGQYVLDSLPVDLLALQPGRGVFELGVVLECSGKRKRKRKRKIAREGLPREKNVARLVALPAAPSTDADNDDDDTSAFRRFAQKMFQQSRSPHLLHYPVGCLALLRQVSAAFPRTVGGSVMMLVGDYFMPSDDRAWLAGSSSIACPAPPDTLVEVSLDLPFISPTADCTALPVVRESVVWAFHRIFGSSGGRISDYSPALSFCASKFSVLALTNTTATTAPTCVTSRFGPNELMLLREIVNDIRYRPWSSDHGSSSPLPFLYAYAAQFCDLTLFMDIRWLVFRHLRDHIQSDDESITVSSWVSLLLRLVNVATEDSSPAPMHRYIGPCTSVAQYESQRLSALQWLIALLSIFAASSCEALVMSAIVGLLNTKSKVPMSGGFPMVAQYKGGEHQNKFILLLGSQEAMLFLLALRKTPDFPLSQESARAIRAALSCSLDLHKNKKRFVKIRRNQTI